MHGEAGVGQVLQERAERLTAAPGDREGVDVAERRTPRRSEGLEVGAEPGRDVVGQPGVEVGGPVTARRERQSRLGPCAAFLGEQPLVGGLVGDLGGQMLQDPAAQPAQLARTERLGLDDQVGLRLDPQVVTQVGGQRVQRLDQHPGLSHVHRTRAQRVSHPGPA